MSTKNSLFEAMTDAQTTIKLTGTCEYPQNGAVSIESEIVLYSGCSDRSLTGCTRGAAGTTAATHVRDSVVTLVASYPSGNVKYLSKEIPDTDGVLTISREDVEKYDILIITAVEDSYSVTLPAPVGFDKRVLTIVNSSSSTGTITIDSVVISAGDCMQYVSDGAAGWSSVPFTQI